MCLLQNFDMILVQKLEEFDEMYYSNFTKIVFMCYMIIMHVLCFNFLIAMMGNTYQKLHNQSKMLFKRRVHSSNCLNYKEKMFRINYNLIFCHQRVEIILLLENYMSKNDLINFQKKYSVNFQFPNDYGLGFTIIKKVDQTRVSTRLMYKLKWKVNGNDSYTYTSKIIKTNFLFVLQKIKIEHYKEDNGNVEG